MAEVTITLSDTLLLSDTGDDHENEQGDDLSQIQGKLTDRKKHHQDKKSLFDEVHVVNNAEGGTITADPVKDLIVYIK